MKFMIDSPILRVAAAVVLTALSGCTMPSVRIPDGAAEDDNVSESGANPHANGGSWEERHILESGDAIHLEVFREPEVSGTFRLTGSGVIRHPLLGEVALGGLSPSQAETLIRERLAEQYLVNPRVILRVERISSLQVVVIGEVVRPGVLLIPPGDRLTLLEAIVKTGGFTAKASRNRVRLVRTVDGKQVSIRVRVASILEGRGGHRDIVLEPGDVISVPEVWF